MTKRRSQEDIAAEELNVNARLGICTDTQTIYNLPEPFITCVFIRCGVLFVNLFHTVTLTHHHFFYNYKNKEIYFH